MSSTATESSHPLGESRAAERRDRLDQLAYIVFEMMVERLRGVTNHQFDDVEDAGLIAALRACGAYTKQIGCLDFGDKLVGKIEGVDGHDYIIQFSLFGPGISAHASRVGITSLPFIVGREGRLDSTFNSMKILEGYSKRLELGRVATDRAFLVGMSLVIGFMDDQGEDPDEDARLAPLLARISPTDDELREIRAKLSPSSINYDEEGDLPY